MGILLIVLGLAGAAVVVDFVVENDLTTAPDQTVAWFGGSFRFSIPEAVLGASVLAAVSVLLVILGVGLLGGSLGRRRALKRQIADLRRENAALQAKSAPTAVSERPPAPGEEGSHEASAEQRQS
jgi:hypothetical protein